MIHVFLTLFYTRSRVIYSSINSVISVAYAKDPADHRWNGRICLYGDLSLPSRNRSLICDLFALLIRLYSNLDNRYIWQVWRIMLEISAINCSFISAVVSPVELIRAVI